MKPQDSKEPKNQYLDRLLNWYDKTKKEDEVEIKKKKQDNKLVHTEESKRKISAAMKSLMTDSRKKEISKKMKETYKSSELREKMSKIMSGKKKNTIWVRNDTTNHIIRIEKQELENYINLGYRRGRFL